MEKITALKLFDLKEEELTQDSINRAYDKLVGTINNDILDEARLELLEDTLNTSRTTYNLASISNELDVLKRELNEFSNSLEENKQESERILGDIKELQARLDELEKSKVQIADSIIKTNNTIYRLEKNIDELEIQKQILAEKEDKKNRENRVIEINNDIRVLSQEVDKVYEDIMHETDPSKIEDLKKQMDTLNILIDDYKKELASLEYAPKKTIYKKRIIRKVKKKDNTKVLTDDEIKNEHPIKVDEVENVENVEDFRNQDEIKELFAPEEVNSYEEETPIVDEINIEDSIDNNISDINDNVNEEVIFNNESIENNESFNNEEKEDIDYSENIINSTDSLIDNSQYEQSIFNDEVSIDDNMEPNFENDNVELGNPTQGDVIDSQNLEDLSNAEPIVNNEEVVSNEAPVEEPRMNIEAELIGEVKPEDELNFSGIQVTKSFVNDLSNTPNGVDLKQDSVEVVQKPLGFMGRLKQKFNNVIYGKAIQETKDNIRRAVMDTYLDNLRIQKVNAAMEALDRFSPQVPDYEKLKTKLYAGKKGKTEYIDYLLSSLDNYENIYPNIKNDTMNSIINDLPTDIDYDIGAAITEVVNSNESNSYNDDDVNALEDFIRSVNEIKGLSTGIAR